MPTGAVHGGSGSTAAHPDLPLPPHASLVTATTFLAGTADWMATRRLDGAPDFFRVNRNDQRYPRGGQARDLLLPRLMNGEIAV